MTRKMLCALALCCLLLLAACGEEEAREAWEGVSAAAGALPLPREGISNRQRQTTAAAASSPRVRPGPLEDRLTRLGYLDVDTWTHLDLSIFSRPAGFPAGCIC